MSRRIPAAAALLALLMALCVVPAMAAAAAELPVRVTVSGDAPSAPETFTLTLRAASDGAPLPEGGCPDGNGMGGPGYCIKGEFAANGVANDLRHTRGVLSMARAQAMDSAGSQFFIMHKDAPHLDGQYAAFGCVMDGMDVVDRIANQPRNMMTNKPKKDQIIAKVTVDTHGETYPEPEKLADPFRR